MSIRHLTPAVVIPLCLLLTAGRFKETAAPAAAPITVSRSLDLVTALSAGPAASLTAGQGADLRSVLEAQEQAPPPPETARRASDSSVPRGIIRHGEHWADLILSQGGSSDPRYLRALRESASALLEQAERGVVPLVNEKIDGSPSISLGFRADGRPFVTYKGDIGLGKRAQRLVTSESEAAAFFDGGLASLYGTAIRSFGPRMEAMPAGEFAPYVFQGDLLFYEDGSGEGRRIATPGSVIVQANSVAYEVKPGHPLFERLSGAKVGVVIHTVGRRGLKDGRVFVEGGAAPALVRSFVERLNGPEVFALHPWRENVAVGTRRPLEPATARAIEALLGGISSKLASLGDDFKREWQVRHEARFRVYFNSFLKAPHEGGLYLEASRQQPFSLAATMRGFGAWLRERLLPSGESGKTLETPSYVLSAIRLLTEHRGELESLLSAYHDALRVQYLLQPHIQEIFESKLGGGESEGVMLETTDTIAKLVDRLGFTLRNNARWNRGSAAPRPRASEPEAGPAGPGPRPSLPEPFDVWRPGAAFVLMKGQPPHAGHIEMIKQAVALNGGGDVFVIASRKGPNLSAADWEGLGLADTKRELAAGEYKRVFSPELRRRLLEAGLDGAARIHVADVNRFWSYLRRAKQDDLEGTVKLVVGAKEMDERRYDDQLAEHADRLEPLVVPMRKESLSGTAVRLALRAWCFGTPTEKRAAKNILDAALSVIPAKAARKVFLEDLAAEWRLADAAVRRLLDTAKPSK